MTWQAFVRYGRSFFTGFIVGLPVYVTVTDFGFCIARVDGISMQPSLNPVANESDVVFLNRWAVRDFKKVNRGDIVSLISPTEPDVKLIKRVVGLEGDIIRTLGYKKPYVLVPKGHCWIEGDHRGRSLDSNTFGPVSLGLVNGLATCVVWPPKRWTKLERTLQDDRIPIKKYLNYYQNEKSSSEKGKIINKCPIIIDKCPIPLEEHIVSKNERIPMKNVEQCITSDVTIETEDNIA